MTHQAADKSQCRILITGADGFIGRSIGCHLSSQGLEVLGVSLAGRDDLEFPIRQSSFSSADLASVLREIHPSVVIHAAGSASVRDSMSNPSADFACSVDLFQRLLEGVRISGARPKVIYFSSASVYGNPKCLPIPETAPLDPISPYGFHKVMCENLGREYATIYSIPVLVLRLFSVFGPLQKRLLLWEIFDQLRNATALTLQGTGNESRDYIHIADLAACVERLIGKFQDGFQVLNLASGTALSVRDAAYRMRDLLGTDKPVIFKGETRAGDPTEWRADISALRTFLGASASDLSFDFGRRLRECIDQWQR